MKRLAHCLAACALAFGVTAAQAAPTLLIDANGELTGANGVDVGGTLYNVRFVDDTCAAALSGCDDASDFAFATVDAATPAAQALMDQVFLDVAGGPLFDSNPALTLGCESAFACQLRTPVAEGTSPTTMVWNEAYNSFAEDQDGFGSGACCGSDQSTNPTAVLAVWTLAAPAQVSEPSSLLAAIAALLALSLVRRRRN